MVSVKLRYHILLVLQWIMSAQIIIAISALCLSLETLMLAGVTSFSYKLGGFILSGSFAIYNLAYQNSSTTGHDGFLPNNRPWFYFLFSFLTAFCLLFYLPISTIFISLTGALMCLAYLFRFRIGNSLIHIRNLPLLKNLWLSFIWAVFTVLVPVSFYQHPVILNEEVSYLFLRRFFFILAIAIPYDIKDYREDMNNKLQTLPVKIGILKTKFTALIALLCFTWLVLRSPLQTATGNFPIEHASPAFYISIFCTALIILITNTSKKKYFFSLLLDGTMIIQYILVVILLKTGFHESIQTFITATTR